jgi:hypothetical protein
MFKTISAALLAVSVLAAPAFAATANGTQAPVTKPTPAKASVLNANTKMGKHHHKYVRHHRNHTKYAAKRTQHAKLSLKHTARPATERG